MICNFVDVTLIWSMFQQFIAIDFSTIGLMSISKNCNHGSIMPLRRFPHYWLLWGETTGGFPLKRTSVAEIWFWYIQGSTTSKHILLLESKISFSVESTSNWRRSDAKVIDLRVIGADPRVFGVGAVSNRRESDWPVWSSSTRGFLQCRYPLTHCGLVTSYGGRDLGQHWFR